MKIRKKNKTDLCLLCNNEFLHYTWDTQKVNVKKGGFVKSKKK